MFFLPILVGGGLLLTAIVAGASKRRDQTTSSDATAAGPAGNIPGATPTSPAGGGTQPLPSDISGLMASVIAGGNPVTMQAAADKLRAQYPVQAAQLDDLIAKIRAVQTATPANTTQPTYTTNPNTAQHATGLLDDTATKTPGIAQNTTPGTTTSTPPAAQTVDAVIKSAPPQVQQAIEAARKLAATQGLELTVADIYSIIHGGTYSLPNRPGASVATQTTTEPPGKALAGQLNLSLRVAKKGTATEPKAQVKALQLSEGFPAAAADGKYGSVVALILAKKYGLVPSQPPMYWGKKNDYKSVQTDKDSYKAALLQLAANEPQRRDEWTNAANQVK